MALKVNNQILKTIRYPTGNPLGTNKVCMYVCMYVTSVGSQQWCNMTKFTFFENKMCSRVLDSLQFLNLICW